VTDWKPLDVLDDLTPEAMREHLLALQTIIARTPVPIAIAYDPHCRFISANRAPGRAVARAAGHEHLADAGERQGRLPDPAERT
jgi:hypothetical protein